MNKNNGWMILIEGLDLAGKSTLTRNLVNHLREAGEEISYARNALVPTNPVAVKADILRREEHTGLLETGALFLAAHLYDAKVFQYPKKGTFHIQDSCWLRTLAYNILYNTRFIPDLVKTCQILQPKFDLVIYLTASNEERRKRVFKRSQESQENDMADYLSWLNPEKLKKNDDILFEETLAIYPETKKIDTTNMSEDAVLKEVIRLLKCEMLLLEKG